MFLFMVLGSVLMSLGQSGWFILWIVPVNVLRLLSDGCRVLGLGLTWTTL